MLVEYKGRMVEIIEISRPRRDVDGFIISANYLDDNAVLSVSELDDLAAQYPNITEATERLLDDGL